MNNVDAVTKLKWIIYFKHPVSVSPQCNENQQYYPKYRKYMTRLLLNNICIKMQVFFLKGFIFTAEIWKPFIPNYWKLKGSLLIITVPVGVRSWCGTVLEVPVSFLNGLFCFTQADFRLQASRLSAWGNDAACLGLKLNAPRAASPWPSSWTLKLVSFTYLLLR